MGKDAPSVEQRSPGPTYEPHASAPPSDAAGLRAIAPERPTTTRVSAPRSPSDRQVQVCAGREIPYTVRVSRRARLLRLVIHPDRGLEVVTPIGTPQRRVEQVLAAKSTWIARTLERIEREHAATAPPPLQSGRILTLAGGPLRLAVTIGAPLGRYRAARSGDTLTLTVHDAADDTVRRALHAWYRQQAPAIFAARLAACNAIYGYAFGRISIKEQKSRWGSCSRRGNLNFNWRLLLAPLPVLDYVVIHELCHLKELNHSERFWRLVARGCPDYKTYRRWLRDHGRTLVF